MNDDDDDDNNNGQKCINNVKNTKLSSIMNLVTMANRPFDWSLVSRPLFSRLLVRAYLYIPAIDCV